MDKKALDVIKCRVCLGEYEKKRMHELFTNDEENVDNANEDNQHLNRKIEYCCGIRIRRLSHLPTKVCERCCDFVQMWYNFRKMCLNTQVYLESTHIMLEGRPHELIDASDSAYMEHLFETLQLQKYHQNDTNEEGEELQPASITELDAEYVVCDYDETDDSFVADTEPQDRPKQIAPESITVVEDYQADEDNIEVEQNLIYAEDSQPEEDESYMPIKIEHCHVDYLEDEYDEFLSPTPSPDPKPSKTTSKRKPGRPRKPDNELKTKRKTKSELHGKVEQQPEDEPSKYMCNLCGNVYPKKAAFTAHMTAHTDYKPHQCEICCKTFRQMGELRAHIRRHTGERPYKCAYCERHFYDRSEKVRHERVHTNTRPYECKECGKTFTHTAILKNHSLMHSGQKNFNCSICSKSFTLLHQLKAHLQTLTHKSKEEQTFASSNSSNYTLSH